ncbi:MAG: acryloyl-CoA reductase [Alphaproteobacteria bacterium]|nr:acryloyl-CoA reductase [Alphaproteobacteria bacterium]MBL6777119.1 acryloyl-CoA reductase [Alphaproteobacteria bacterium]
MFDALVLEQDDAGKTRSEIRQVDNDFLGEEGEVLVAVEYAGVNYKDGLCINGLGRLIREFPRIPGVEFSGEVLESRDARYKQGDKVIATGWRIGEISHGGYAQRARIKADQLVPMPASMTTRQAMILGTPGLTAMFGLQALEAHGLTLSKGDDAAEVLVTGAAGGVGSISVALLSALGYRVAAVTGRIDASGDFLRQMGAHTLIARDDLSEASARPLESERWLSCIDNVGGQMLARILGQLSYGGSVAAIGNAGGNDLPANVLPFLLRGVNLLGIDSVFQPCEHRVAAWERLAAQFPMEKLETIVTEINLGSLEETSKAILKGEIQGRCLVCL